MVLRGCATSVAIVAAILATLVAAWWTLTSFAMPECVSYDAGVQNLYRAAAALILLGTASAWFAGIGTMARTAGWRRVAASFISPVAIVSMLFGIGYAAAVISDRIDPNGDAAHCM